MRFLVPSDSNQPVDPYRKGLELFEDPMGYPLIQARAAAPKVGNVSVEWFDLSWLPYATYSQY